MSDNLYDSISSLNAIAAEVFAAEVEMARRTENLGDMARVMAQVTLPHSKPTMNEYTRHNGGLTLSMWSPLHVGLPYGGVPRLLIAWLTTEAVRTRERKLVLGPTLSGFMAQIGLVPTGGRWGTIPRLKEQLRRLFTSQIVCTFDDVSRGSSLGVASEYELWWNPKKPSYGTLWNSAVTLGEKFFDDIIERPVPVDVATLRQLKRSPLELDLYTWPTYRYSYLERETLILWEGLQAQFGSDYKELFSFRFKMKAAVSTGERNEFVEFLLGHPIAEGPSWSPVQTALDREEILFTQGRQISPLGHVLAKQTVSVLVRSALPRRVRVTEVDGHARRHADRAVSCHLRSLVPSHRSHELGRQRRNRLAHRGLDRGCGVIVREVQEQHEASGSLHQSTDGTAAAGAHDEVSFPMAGNRAVVDFGRTFRDHHHVGNPALSIDSSLGAALCASQAQVAGEFAT